MKYILAIELDEDYVPMVKETSNEGLTPIQARLIVSILAEYQNKIMGYIIFNQNTTNLKEQKKN